MAHEYEERFVGYGKDRVSWNYELAAKRVRFWVPPDAFLVHFETHDLEEASAGGGGGDDAAAAGGGGGSSGSSGTGGTGGSGSRVRPKKQYGHHPTDWMLGESCWPSFRDRVQAQYNFSVYTCHQTMIDGLQRGRFEACASETERVCVRPFCTPRTTVLAHPLPPTAGRPPRVSASPARNLTSYPDVLATTLSDNTLTGGARAEMTKPEMRGQLPARPSRVAAASAAVGRPSPHSSAPPADKGLTPLSTAPPLEQRPWPWEALLGTLPPSRSAELTEAAAAHVRASAAALGLGSTVDPAHVARAKELVAAHRSSTTRQG